MQSHYNSLQRILDETIRNNYFSNLFISMHHFSGFQQTFKCFPIERTGRREAFYGGKSVGVRLIYLMFSYTTSFCARANV